jgi:tetratricopeptide (TPR) repeat protein
MRKVLLIIYGSLLFLRLIAQDQKYIDSLILKLDQKMIDTARINLLNTIASEIYFVNPDQINEFAQKALDLSEDLNYKKGIAEAYNNLGIYYRNKGIYDLAIDYFFNSLEIMEKTRNRKGIARCYNLIGIIYYNMQDNKPSLEYFNKALEINIEQNDKKWIAGNYNNVGLIYERMGDYSLALEYYFKALEANIETNNKNWIAINYGNIGSLYLLMGNPKSLDYFQKRLKINKDQKDVNGMALANYLIGRYYNSQKDFSRAISYLLRGYSLSDSSGNLLLANDIAKELSLNFAENQNYKEAYHYQHIYKQLSDSLNFLENAQKITRLEMQYQFKKDQQLIDLTDQKTKLLQSSIALLLGFLVLISFLFIGRQRGKVKQNELEHRKLELENTLLKEELHYKDRSLQDNVKYLVSKNELIMHVSERLIKEKPAFKKENQKIIEDVILELQSNIEDDVWEEFEIRFKQLHSDFNENLNKYSPDLTSNDKKLCAFLRLKMSTKEIASITGQSTSSIETARTRLRKKFNISNQDLSLQEFLEKF